MESRTDPGTGDGLPADARSIVEASRRLISAARAGHGIPAWDTAVRRILDWAGETAAGRPQAFTPADLQDEVGMLLADAPLNQSAAGVEPAAPPALWRGPLVPRSAGRAPIDLTAARVARAARARISEAGGLGLAGLSPSGGGTADALAWNGDERFRTVFEDAPVGIALISASSIIMRANRALRDLLGYGEEELAALGLGQILHPDDVQYSLEIVGRARRDAPSQAKLAARYLTKSGESRWGKFTVQWPLDPDGEVRYGVGTVEDITHQKHVEWLERDRNRILEMIARGGRRSEVLEELTRLVERRRPEVACAILVHRDGGCDVIAPSLPFELARALGEGRRGSETYPDPAERYGWRPAKSAQIVSGDGDVLGTVSIYVCGPYGPDRLDDETLETARRLTAVAIERSDMAEQLSHQARHDALTGLPNRVLYEDRLQQALARAQTAGRLVALFLIDLDRFKRINDTLGHRVGDELLVGVARRLEACARQQDTVARWGGDEFTIVLTDLKSPEEAARFAEELLTVLRRPFVLETGEQFVTASIGIGVYPADARDAGDLLRAADAAMYRAESHGKNTYAFFSPSTGTAASMRLDMENRLRGALDRNELELYYQPLVELAGGSVTGAEALLRWNHPERGIVPAAEFVPVAEESGLIVPISRRVLEEACRRNRAWHDGGVHNSLRVGVNVPAVGFGRPDFVPGVMGVLAATGLPAQGLDLEVVESVLMHDIDASARQIAELREAGVTVSLDDFGTGYSSLSYLHRLPIDTLKIDRSFIRGIDPAAGPPPVVRAIVALAHSLGISVTAEGVETPEQLRVLQDLGCDKAQGYLFSRPLPAAEFEAYLRRPRE
jgi:diguanylate cyclase (GGDEF)-like protein/PAS domain S-box-containing protein